ncbi:hypothetical protein BOX15_Mlig005965g1 [Macrostomum lignano]|uniref:Methyltransferase domain-containing protein n=1 Tax=Macrostomum lignano TaxID=282301 RepID=A0A267F4P8_9PLAT|nr:hypothetical protein BOX15_Mlig005965g1 [Macrostomum lignano]
MRGPLSLPLPRRLRQLVLANYACPGNRTGHLARLAFRLASHEQQHASRLCAEACIDLLPAATPASPATCLEVGFGAGHALAELRRLRPVGELRLLGVDASSLALKLATAQLGIEPDNAKLFHCQADDLLPVATGSCNLVAQVNCFGVLPRAQLAGACREAYRVLRPDGRLVAVADCWLTSRLVAELGRPDLLDSLAALEAAGFSRLKHSRRQCRLTGRPLHLVTAEVR